MIKMTRNSISLLEKTHDNLYDAAQNFEDFTNSLDEKGQNIMENNFIQELLKLTIKDKLEELNGLVYNMLEAANNSRIKEDE